MSATELRARSVDQRLTDRQRAEARRNYGLLMAAQAGCDAYGTRVWDVQRGQS